MNQFHNNIFLEENPKRLECFFYFYTYIYIYEKDFLLMFNQFDGSEASKQEFFRDSGLDNFMGLLFGCLAVWLKVVTELTGFLTKCGMTPCFSAHAWPPTGHFPHGDRVAKITWHGSLNIARKAATKVLRSKQERSAGSLFQVRTLSCLLPDCCLSPQPSTCPLGSQYLDQHLLTPPSLGGSAIPCPTPSASSLNELNASRILIYDC